MKNLTAVILCGGKGTRLNYWKKMPKTLVKIQGKPIIWYIVKILKKNSLITLFYRSDTKECRLK